MSTIKPFKGLRPKREFAAEVASPPYDVLNSEEARIMAKGNPNSFLHVVKPEIDLEPNVNLYADIVYAKGAENLKMFEHKGIMSRDDSANFYLYEQTMKIGGTDHTQIGVVAGVSVAEYENGLIKKHELTRADKEADRTKHVEVLNANTGPVFLTYTANDAINQLITQLAQATPEYDFVASDDIRHRFWTVSQKEDIKALESAFEKLPCLYVADGHHRSASGAAVAKKRAASNPKHTGEEGYNYFLAVIFPHDQMYIMDYNRVVFDLNNLSNTDFLAKVSEKFDVSKTDIPSPKQGYQFGMYLDKTWYRLVAKPGTFDSNNPVESLDVSILQNNLLAPILNIGDPRIDKRIDFIGGIRGTQELEKRVNEGCAVAFAMFPTSIEQLMAIADADQIMPPKSTWFEPKLRSGVVVRPLDE